MRILQARPLQGRARRFQGPLSEDDELAQILANNRDAKQASNDDQEHGSDDDLFESLLRDSQRTASDSSTSQVREVVALEETMVAPAQSVELALDQEVLVRHFVEGLKINADETLNRIKDKKAFMQSMGGLLFHSIDGIRKALQTQDRFMDQYRIPGTVLGRSHVNPLYTHNIETADAIEILLTNSVSAIADPTSAVQEATRDFYRHGIAVPSGVDAAIKRVMHLLDWEEIEKKVGASGGLGKVGPLRKSSCWDSFCSEYDRLYATLNEFDNEFRRAVGTAYSHARNQFNQQRIREHNMANKDAVVWHEGMFMRQQHFQQHTRYVEGLVSESLHTTNRFAWGFVSLELDTSELSNGLLGIKQARGVLPDSTPFSFDVASGAPVPLDISAVEPGSLIYLCLGQRDGGRHKQEYSRADGQGLSTRFQTYTSEIIDSAAEVDATAADNENLAASKPKTGQLVLGQLNLRLLVESDESRDQVRLPFARVAQDISQGGVQIDPDFIAPVTDIQASPRIKQYVRELRGIISSRADELAQTVGDLVSGAEFSPNVLWLMVANRYDSLLGHIVPSGSHPAELYRQMISLVGETATFTSPSRRPGDLPTYNHANLAECLVPLIEEVYQGWTKPVDVVVKDLPLRFAADHKMWAWLIRDHNIFEDASFVLAAKADITEDELAERLPELMLVSPIESIDERISDFQLVVAKIKPRGVPVLNRWTYFHLEPKRKTWGDVMDSKALAFFVDRLDHEFASLDLRLWAIPER